MIDREFAFRRRARGAKFGEVLIEEDRPEDQYQCSVCKVFLYLSQITCQCTTQVTCMDHPEKLCKCSLSSRVLRKRFSDEELTEALVKVSDRARVPEAWRSKLTNLLSSIARPQLRSLRAILAEGERISYPMPELHALRRCVSRGNEWVEQANMFLRKASRKRARKSARPGDVIKPGVLDDSYDRPERGLEDVYALLREVEGLGFDGPELDALRTLAKDAEDVKAKARHFLAAPEEERCRPGFVQDCENLGITASSLNVYIQELFEVEQIVLRDRLMKDIDDWEAGMLMDDVRNLVARARACSLPAESRHMKVLNAKQAAGSSWEDGAKALIAQRVKNMEELEEFAKTESNVPVDGALLDRIMNLHGRAKEYQRQADAILHREPGVGKVKPQDAMKLVTRAEGSYNIPSINDLRRTTDFALDLESRCEMVMRGAYQHVESDGDVFNMFQQWKNYAKEHLTMFTIPNFEKFERRLADHYRWIDRLPWNHRRQSTAQATRLCEDVMEATQINDDTPSTDEYLSCICITPVRPPAPGTVSDAVQCDHCFARFHGACASSGGSCPFCDHHHWNGSIHKERNWHYCYLVEVASEAPLISRTYSPEWKQVEALVFRVDRLVQQVGQFLSFASHPANQRSELLPRVKHYMRKLYRLQFVVGHSENVSYGLDLAGLHRLLASQPAQPKNKKRKRPKLTFGQDYDKDWTDGTRCICRGRTEYLINYPKVQCESCQRYYHSGCVFFPNNHADPSKNIFTCPLCCLRKNKKYPYSEVRVRSVGEHHFYRFIEFAYRLYPQTPRTWIHTLIPRACCLPPPRPSYTRSFPVPIHKRCSWNWSSTRPGTPPYKNLPSLPGPSPSSMTERRATLSLLLLTTTNPSHPS